MTSQPDASPSDLSRGSTSQRFDSLTGMRALAAMSVAIHHSIAFWPPPDGVSFLGQFGYLGVDFFFVLSGFVMQWAWHRGTTTRDFLVRRVARIYPLIVVTLGASLAAYWAWADPLAGYIGPKSSIGWNLLDVQSWFFNDALVRQAWNGVTWSLCCEMFFYVCSPFLLSRLSNLKAKTCLIWIGILFGAECLAQALTVPSGSETVQNFFYYFPPARFPEFIMGALACRALIAGYRIRIRRTWLVAAVGVLCPLILYANFVPLSSQFLSYSSLVATPGFVLVILVSATEDVRRDSKRRLLTTRQMVWMGDVSYAYYMVHALVLGLVARWLMEGGLVPTTKLDSLFWIVVFLGASQLVAWASWRLLERPAQRLIIRLLGSRRDQPGPQRRRPPEIGSAVTA